MTADVTELLKDVICSWRPSASVASITPVTPDASLRRYYRLVLSDTKEGCPASLIAMIFDSVAVPEVEGVKTVDADQAVVELTPFLRRHGIPVPELYFDARARSVLLLEDCGDETLASLVSDQTRARYSDEERDARFRAAIDVLVRYQQIPQQPDFFPFLRAMAKAVYQKEMEEFRDYVLELSGLSAEQNNIVDACLTRLSEELDRAPRVLVHRDFHGWNLHLDPDKKIRVLDFQDSLLGTKSYDLVGLLNDRDMDSALGQERYLMLFDYFFARAGCDSSFYAEYDRALLQRDLKVAGRFSKLVRERGLTQYGQWIPGTLQRIGRTLQRLTVEPTCPVEYRDFLSLILEDSFSLDAVREGYESPLVLDDPSRRGQK